jgi:hypothetical protein
VYDSVSGAPLEGVRIRDSSGGQIVITTAAGMADLGFVTFQGLTASVELLKLGYQRALLALQRGDTAPIAYRLNRVAELPTVTTTAKYRLDLDEGRRQGFAERCTVEHVSCFPERYLTSGPAYSLVDILKTSEGIRIRCGGSRTSTKCSVTSNCLWFVDGFDTPKTIAEATPLTFIQNIEVYRRDGPSPQRFSPQSPFECSIVMWTK